jgi:alkanesulfonate monooxygenase SsuD/methylene tetrahydromethanopterin reductase-like flavin-dependent oxidoreductase (luciferase family)
MTNLERRFQVEVLPDLEWKEFLRRFRHAEELGFDIATTADQFVDWKDPSVPWFDVWTALAAVAQATERIRLAPCVAQIPMRDPATFARQVITIDHVSGGRVEAGLGLGLTVDPGYGMIGVPNWDNPERARRFKEYIEIVDQMLSGSPTEYAGTYYTVKSATVHESIQSPRPPITIAAMGPKMMRYAATYGDTLNAMSFRSGVAALTADAAALKMKMDQACDKVGRDPSTLRYSFLLFDSNARESGVHLFYWESIAQFADVAGQILALGFEEVGVYYPVDAQRDVFERVASEIMPSLRAA